MLKIRWLLLFNIFCNGINAQDTIQAQGRFAVPFEVSDKSGDFYYIVQETESIFIPIVSDKFIQDTFNYDAYNIACNSKCYVTKFCNRDFFMLSSFRDTLWKYETHFPNEDDSLQIYFDLCTWEKPNREKFPVPNINYIQWKFSGGATLAPLLHLADSAILKTQWEYACFDRYQTYDYIAAEYWEKINGSFMFFIYDCTFECVSLGKQELRLPNLKAKNSKEALHIFQPEVFVITKIISMRPARAKK